MIAKHYIITIFVILFSCNESRIERNKIARVHDKFLYSDQISQVPENQDSFTFVNNYINNWAKNELLISKAKFNIDKTPSHIDSLVERYKSSLLTHHYKQLLIQSQLNRNIEDSIIEIYYANNIENFMLKENLFKIKYVKIKKIAPKLEFLELNFPPDSLNFKKIEDYCLQFSEKFFFNNLDWISSEDILSELPSQIKESDIEKKFKKGKTVIVEDSLYNYYLYVDDLETMGSPSPLDYVSLLIEKIIINKRKKDLINDIEFNLLQKAMINNNFEIYE